MALIYASLNKFNNNIESFKQKTERTKIVLSVFRLYAFYY